MQKLLHKPVISIIAAIDENNALGFKNKLLCHLPDDLKNFKKITLNKPVIMGRKTFESIGKPLKDRLNIVLSSKKIHSEVVSANSLAQAIDLCTDNYPEIMIIGGQSVYEEAILIADKLYITKILHKFSKADVYFPEIDIKKWQVIENIPHEQDDAHAFNFNFITYNKI